MTPGKQELMILFPEALVETLLQGSLEKDIGTRETSFAISCFGKVERIGGAPV